MSDPTKLFKYKLSGTTYDLSATFLPVGFGFANNTISNFVFGIGPATDLNLYFARKSNSKASSLTTGFRYTQGSNIYDLSNLFEPMPPCIITGDNNPTITTLNTDYTFITFVGNDTSKTLTTKRYTIQFTKNMNVGYIVVGTGAPGSIFSSGKGGNGGVGGAIAHGSFNCNTTTTYNIRINNSPVSSADSYTGFSIDDTTNFIKVYNGIGGNGGLVRGSFDNNNYYFHIRKGGTSGAGGTLSTPTGGNGGVNVSYSELNSTKENINFTGTFSNTTGILTLPTAVGSIKFSLGNGGGGGAYTSTNARGGTGGGLAGGSGGTSFSGNSGGGGGGGAVGSNGTLNKGGAGGFQKILETTVSSGTQSYGNGGGGGGATNGGAGSPGAVILYFKPT